MEKLNSFKTICIVVSPSGLGHMTRQIALAIGFQKIDPTIKIRYVCTEEQMNMVGYQLKQNKNISFYPIPLTPKFVMSKWDEIDRLSTLDSFQRSIDFGSQIRDDTEWGRILFGCNIIINDIESIHNPIAIKMKIPILNISNFTWSDILLYLDDEILAKQYTHLEKLADFHFQLPFHTDCIGFSNAVLVGLLTREINWEKVSEIQEKSKTPLVFISYSGDIWEGNLPSLVKSLNAENIVPIIPDRFNKNLENLQYQTFKDNDPHTNSIVVAADVAISKVGYGMTSEIFAGGTYFIHFTRSGYVEDIALSKNIVDQGYGERINPNITEEELILKVLNGVSKKLEKKEIKTLTIVRSILELIK